jgi:hypothetical protein
MWWYFVSNVSKVYKCKILLSNLPSTSTSHLKQHNCALVIKGNSSMDEFVTKKN